LGMLFPRELSLWYNVELSGETCWILVSRKANITTLEYDLLAPEALLLQSRDLGAAGLFFLFHS
jgi:hypothetical protein